MTNVNDIIWTKELVRCTHSSFWKKTRKKTLTQYVADLQSFYDVSHLFFLVCKHPDKNACLPSWSLAEPPHTA